MLEKNRKQTFKLQQYNDDWQEYLNLCEKEILEYEHK